ncbi:methionyl-tRNA formyltransferase [Jidongwangia harbinensis]|uniref:methionyl-tRNA formyltransferase n=1 Tax=Jidongwangia harbinensis TaxID=2878561 RepID=UPI001CDA0ED6|nr:methionyl-tRNA formyltransferase [Jidongwangia harbinensis]MCA2215603.1 methionyl-tRNA formyltransferase [Jidongwangia harbinensis]
MRVILFGYQTWGHRTLQALLNSPHEVALVVTHPRSDHAYEQMWDDSVADLARANGIPTILKQRPDDELADEVKRADADIIVATNWRTWLPPEIYDTPRLGTLNLHDSLLPSYAGFSPLVWALINGEPEVGVTAHLMDAELDAGDIVLQRSVPVGPTDTTADLFHRTLELFGPLTVDGLALVESGRRDFVPQDRTRASFFHKRSIEDSRIDWNWPAEDLERFVRALCDPYPNAFTTYRGQRLRIIEAGVSRGCYGGTPGRVFIREDDGIVIVAGADARRGRNHGLLVKRVRTEDDTDHAAVDFFQTMGGYLGERGA